MSSGFFNLSSRTSIWNDPSFSESLSPIRGTRKRILWRRRIWKCKVVNLRIYRKEIRYTYSKSPELRHVANVFITISASALQKRTARQQKPQLSAEYWSIKLSIIKIVALLLILRPSFPATTPVVTTCLNGDWPNSPIPLTCNKTTRELARHIRHKIAREIFPQISLFSNGVMKLQTASSQIRTSRLKSHQRVDISLHLFKRNFINPRTMIVIQPHARKFFQLIIWANHDLFFIAISVNTFPNCTAVAQNRSRLKFQSGACSIFFSNRPCFKCSGNHSICSAFFSTSNLFDLAHGKTSSDAPDTSTCVPQRWQGWITVRMDRFSKLSLFLQVFGNLPFTLPNIFARPRSFVKKPTFINVDNFWILFSCAKLKSSSP